MVLLAVFLLAVPAFSQDEDAKKTALSIKKNPDFIYGEAAGDDSDEALYQMAQEKLIERIKLYVASNPELSAADGVIIDRVQKKTKKITYTRGLETKVMCLYVKKDEILPLVKSAGGNPEIVVQKEEQKTEPVTQETPADDYQTDFRKRQEALQIVEQGRTEAQLATGMNVHIDNNTIEDPKEVSDDEDLTDEDIAEIMSSMSKEQYQLFENLALAETEAEGEDEAYIHQRVIILSVICQLKNYDQVKRFLIKRQTNNRGLMFKLTPSFDHEGCFWAIFNSNQELVSLLSPSLDYDLMHKTDVDGRKKYARGAKLWIRFL